LIHWGHEILQNPAQHELPQQHSGFPLLFLLLQKVLKLCSHSMLTVYLQHLTRLRLTAQLPLRAALQMVSAAELLA
jgi:hypothetical protein